MKWGGSYIDSSDWIKNKKSAVNTVNGDGKCFEYVAAVTLNHKEWEKSISKTQKLKINIKN